MVDWQSSVKNEVVNEWVSEWIELNWNEKGKRKKSIKEKGEWEIENGKCTVVKGKGKRQKQKAKGKQENGNGKPVW